MSRYVGNAVCIRYPGGAIYLGLLTEATPTDLLLETPYWVAHTGRLGPFFAGQYDDQCEWEPMGKETEIPRAHAEISPWPNALPVEARPPLKP
jgi:hypothetical protein